MTLTLVGCDYRTVMFTQRGHNQVMNEQHLETMMQIRDIYLQYHFMTGAYTRYPGVFAKRSKRWQLIKARTVHHQRPNEWTGALRRAVLSDSICRSTATRGTFEAKAPPDSVVKFGPKAGQRIRRPLTEQRRKEMEHVSEDEIWEQGQRMSVAYAAAMFDPRYTQKVLKQFR